MKRELPSLNALKAFEAAIRTGSFTSASAELNVTHGAVSKQIQRLEDWIGHKLFTRAGQRLIPTTGAIALAAQIGDAFDRLADSVSGYGSPEARHIIYVAAPATFAMRWLIPRLESFYLQQPHIDVRIRTTSMLEAALPGAFDVIVRREPPQRGRAATVHFLNETSTLMASPKLLRRAPLESTEDIFKHTILTTESRPSDWDNWLRAAKLNDRLPKRRHNFDHFFVAMQAALDGLGLMIGPLPLLDDDVATGRLLVPFPDTFVVENGYGAEIARVARGADPVSIFVEWLVEVGKPTI